MPQKIQLAAIMLTDIVGYAALVGKNKTKTLDYMDLSRSAQKKLVEEFDGNWLKELDHGVICTFSSATDAVYCALEIQEQLREHHLELRIGIHWGELIGRRRVYAADVDTVSRLQAIAEPGGIYMSEPIHKGIRGQSDLKTVYLGELPPKNANCAIKTYALGGNGLPPVINGAAKRLSGRLWVAVKHGNGAEIAN